MYAVETRFDLVLGGGSAVRRAEGFGLDAVSVDGQDVAAVYRAVHAAAERARAGGGASFVEARTYRYEGHNTGQIITYRTDDEVADWRLRDPINRFSAALVAAGVDRRGRHRGASTGRATDAIDEAVAFAESSPLPRSGHARRPTSPPCRPSPGSPDERDDDVRRGLPARHGRRDGARRDDLRARHRPLRARRPLRAGQGPRRALRAARACATRRSPRPRWWPPASARRCTACARSSISTSPTSRWARWTRSSTRRPRCATCSAPRCRS